MKNKVLSVIKYNIEKNIRNKWFIILNILLFLITLISINFSTIKTFLKNNNISFKEKTEIFVYDEENLIYSFVEESLKDEEDVSLIKENEKKEYNKDNVSKNQVIVVVSKEESNILAKVISQEGVSATYVNIIEQGIKSAREKEFATKNNISIEELKNLDEAPKIDRVMLGVDNTDTDKKYAMQSIFNYLIFFILLVILSKIANDISQEKLSKSIEYVLTSINVKGYLIAKVLSVNLTFIIQFIFTLMYFIISMFVNSIINMYVLNPNVTLDSASIDMTNISSFIDTNLILYFIIVFIYLVLTIFLLSIIQAVLSSKTTNINEASNSTIVLITVNLIIYIISTFFVTPLKAPSILTYILSCIPICSMYFVPTMVLISQASIVQVIIATIILLITIAFMLKYATVWFKNGVLNYTNKKSKNKEEVQDEIRIQKEKVAKTEYSKIGYVIGLSVIIFIILQLGLTYILQMCATPLYNFLQAKISLEDILSIVQIVSFVVSLVIPSLVVLSYVEKEKNKVQKASLKTNIKYILMSLPVVLIVQVIVSFITQKLGINYDILEKANIYNDSSTLGKVLLFVQVAILPAIFEEMFIRKALLKFARKIFY